MAERYPRALIKIHVLVTCDDGGATSAAINAAGLALVDAGIFLRGVVAAARVGAPVAATTLVDPNRAGSAARRRPRSGLSTVLRRGALDGPDGRAAAAAGRLRFFDSAGAGRRGEGRRRLATAARDHVARLDAVRARRRRPRSPASVHAQGSRRSAAAVLAREVLGDGDLPLCRRSPGLLLVVDAPRASRRRPRSSGPRRWRPPGTPPGSSRNKYTWSCRCRSASFFLTRPRAPRPRS